MVHIKYFILAVNSINDWLGKITSMIIFPIIGILVFEVIMRYLFSSPTIWAHELSAILYAIFFLIGGAYTLKWKAHINVDVIYKTLPLRIRAMIDIVSWIFFYFFILVMFLKGISFAWSSIKVMERASTVWEPYIWPSKICIPVGAFFTLLQGVTKTINDIYILFTGKELIIEYKEESKK